MNKIRFCRSIQKRIREETGIKVRVFKPYKTMYIVWPHDDSGDLSLQEIKINYVYNCEITEDQLNDVVKQIKKIEYER